MFDHTVFLGYWFLSKAYYSQTSHAQEDRKQLTALIGEQESSLCRARELLLSGQIDPDDYRAMKSEHEERLNRLQVKASALATQTENFDTLLNVGLDNLFRLNEIYHNGTIIEKRQAIGSVYPKN